MMKLRRFSLVLGRKDSDIAAVIDRLEPTMKNQYIKTAIRYYMALTATGGAKAPDAQRPALQLQKENVSITGTGDSPAKADLRSKWK